MNAFEGKLIVITAPSGAGKTTIVKHLLTVFDNIDFSVSATTRQKRPNETEGVDYFFLTPADFKNKIEAGQFAEYEMVYTDQYYGTLVSEIERIWSENKHIIFDIDVQGALTLKKKFGTQCMTIFVKPPSSDILFERLRGRNTETPEALQKRIDKATIELAYEKKFDYVLVNNILEDACNEAELVIRKFIASPL